MYEIRHSLFFEKQLEKIKDRGVINQILKGIQDLGKDPNIGENLLYELRGYRSLRVGDWRVVYQFNDNIVNICAMGHGHDAYNEMKKYLRSTK